MTFWKNLTSNKRLSQRLYCDEFGTNMSLSTYFFVLFMLIWQSLNSAHESTLSVREWFKLATTFCTLWLWLFCVRFSMLFTAQTTAPDVHSFESLPNIGGFFALFQALAVTIRLNATLASVAWSLQNCMNGYSSLIQSRDGCRSNTMVCVDLAQACCERYFLHRVTQFIHSNWWIFKPYFVAREKISLWFLKQCSLVRI